MRKPKDDTQVFIAMTTFQFDYNGRPVTVQKGRPICGSKHPYRLGREHNWFPFKPQFERVPGMPDLPAEVTIPVGSHAPSDSMSDTAPSGVGFWTFVTLRVVRPDPWAGESVHAPEDPPEEKPVAVNARGPNPFTSDARPVVASLFTRRRKNDAVILQDIEAAGGIDVKPRRLHYDAEGNPL